MTDKEALLIQKAYEEVKKHQNKDVHDPYRLTYHLMPPVGLLNDPNGLIQYKGVYHVFYQWNPFETAHGAKFWGHYTSRDMVHWQEEPIALAPSEWYERNGCYSGSAVESDGKLYLFYTGNVKRDDGSRETYQCIAVSSDGIHFEKHGPVLRLPGDYTAHFRDPKVWKKADRWYMIVGAQTLDEKGTAVLFTSMDLYHWEEAGRIAGSGMNGMDDFGYMWECPDLIHVNGKDILLVSPQGLEPSGYLYHNLFQSGYFIGELDYETLTFQHGPFRELDRGFDFYAPQTFTDEWGRTILYGWMGITDETESYQPTIANHWVHALTIPRELVVLNGKVYQRPVDELKKLRKDKIVVENKGKQIESNGVSAELLLNFVKAGSFQISFRNEAYLYFDSDKQEVYLQRRDLKTGALETRTCKQASVSKLQIFMDHSSLEIFVNEGEEVFTTRYFPNPNDDTIIFHGEAEFEWTKWNLG
ncbi:sucrose-6-phosphate hydrolase [Neobacillus vireti]|uniref:Sucrose-6-phosphate hydrolase n=1 Tax=Neobacillus vireti LMG 21834 TaxID=1131730 RepID=A0AB94IIH2_9BACI|nr:sucrose-6-phosphate hydrolase [Neobacillus vireti]ETI66846.1 sucrose-6-phosphate hydrolase [Neobacillus vireti LMG 21834]KLT16753.1 sucrose-6-phosphate hydrolase [Neobacillus vireti]